MAEYWLPPTKTIAKFASTVTPMATTPPIRPTAVRLRSRVRRRDSATPIDGKASTTTNCGRKSTAFVRMSPPA